MMSWTRLYVESTETLMGQVRIRIFLTVSKNKFENMWGKNSFLLNIISKDSKKACKKQKSSIQRGRKLDKKVISQQFMLS